MTRSSPSSEPTFESIRRECTAENAYTSKIELSIGIVSCRFNLRRKSARMDFDLSQTRFNIVPDRWREIIKQQKAYVETNFARTDWKDMTGQFLPDGMCFDVLREDAEEWFELISGRLDRQVGMTGVSPLTRKRGW